MNEIHTDTLDYEATTAFSLFDYDPDDADEGEDVSDTLLEADDSAELEDTTDLPASGGTDTAASGSGHDEASGFSPPPVAIDSTLPPAALDQELLFRQLINDHQRRLYRFVIKYIDHPDDAADITQQAFVEAARTISSFRGDSKLSTWLFGIAMNMVRNYLSRAPHRVHKFETDDSLLAVASSEPDPSDCLVQKELLMLAERAFGELPSEMSEVLGLVAIDEISYQEAADLLDIPLGTVRSRVSRARAVMRAQFEQAGVKLQF